MDPVIEDLKLELEHLVAKRLGLVKELNRLRELERQRPRAVDAEQAVQTTDIRLKMVREELNQLGDRLQCPECGTSYEHDGRLDQTKCYKCGMSEVFQVFREHGVSCERIR